MGLYILNREQILIKSVPNRGLISLIQEEEINKADTLRAEIDLEDWKGSGDKLVDESFYMAVNDPYVKDDIHVYKISTMIEHVNHIELVGVNFAYDELKARRRIGEIVGTNYSARGMLEFITSSYGWGVGVVDDDLPTFSIDIRNVSHLDAIKYLIEHTGGEVNFRAKMINGKITERKIDFVKELSEFKGKRFALGSNLIDVVMEEDESELYTAIVGTGATVKIDEDDPDSGERVVTLDEVEWSIANGDPVDKPLGMDYVEILEATEKYGYADGSPRIGHVSFSNERNPENVLILSYNELLEASRPKKQFSATVDTIGEDMELGETVVMVKPGTDFRYKTRVFKIQRDYLDNNRTKVEFGDRLVTSTLERLRLIKEEAVEDVKDDINKSVRDAVNQGIADGSIGGGGGTPVIISDKYSVSDVTTKHTSAIIASADSGAGNGAVVSTSSLSNAEGLYSQVNSGRNSNATGGSSQVNSSYWSNAEGSYSQVNSSDNSTASGCNSQVNSSIQSKAEGIYSQVNSSHHSNTTGERSQVNSSHLSNTIGDWSQVNSSDGSTAIGRWSQVNSSYRSKAIREGSQVNSSSRSNVTEMYSQVISSLRTENNTPFSTAWGYGTYTSDTTTANIKAQIFSDTGDIRHSGVLSSGHNFTDYAEMFPNLTGEEQGYGLLQTVDGYGVRPTRSGEKIIGVTSATAGVILGDTPFSWAHRWVIDKWGETVYHEVPDNNWVPNTDDGETEEDRPTIKVPKENPEWDPNREQISRKDRPDEWTVVGLVGQMYVRLDKDVEPMDYVKAGNFGIGKKSEEETNVKVMRITTPYNNDDGYKIGFCIVK